MPCQPELPWGWFDGAMGSIAQAGQVLRHKRGSWWSVRLENVPELAILLFGRPGSVLVRTHYGTVDEDFLEVSVFAQNRKDVVPGILVGLAGKSNVGAVP